MLTKKSSKRSYENKISLAIINLKLLLINLFIILLISGVFGLSECKTGDCPPKRSFGSGIFTDARDIYKTQADCKSANPSDTNNCHIATAQDLFNEKENVIQKGFQDAMNKEQAEGFNKLMAEKGLGVKLEGDHLAYGKWDGEELVYGKNELNQKILESNGIKTLGLNGNTVIGLNENGDKLIFDANNFKLVDIKSYNLLKKTAFSECLPCGSQSGDLFGSYPSTGASLTGGQGAGQAEQQMLALVQSIVGPLAQIMASNNKGETKASSKNGQPTVSFDREASAQFYADNNRKFSLAQNNLDKKANAVIGKNNIGVENANVVVPEQLAAKTPDEKTDLFLNGIPGNDPNNPTLTEPRPLELRGTPVYQIANYFILINKKLSSILARGLVSAQTENEIGNKIVLEKHNLIVNGKDIDNYALKTFNEMNFKGQDLKFFSGKFEINVNYQKTLVSRNLKIVPYGAKKVINDLDLKNEFRLQHYINRKGEFYDGDKRVSISDIAIKHPKIDHLVVWKERENMWKKT